MRVDLSLAAAGAVDAVRLGEAVTLLQGSRGDRFGLAALHLAPQQPLRLFATDPPPAASAWQPLTASIVRHPDDLIDQLWACHVVPHRHEEPGFDVRASRLVDDHAQARRRALLATRLGIPLVQGRSYLLLAVARHDGRREHEVIAEPPRRFFDRRHHLDPAWRRASARLRPGRRVRDGAWHDAVVTADEAQDYVDAFYSFGTHFVSAMETGDQLVQLAILKPESARWIDAYWHQVNGGRPVHGVAAMPFAAFLTADHAEVVSPIVSLAEDPHLPHSLASGAWVDPASLSGISLAAPFRSAPQHAADLLGGFTAQTLTRGELSPLSRFMEFYRATNFERSLRGALIQRWAERVAIPVRRSPQAKFLKASPATTRVGDTVTLGADRDDVMLARCVIAAAHSDHAPLIRRPDAVFDQPPFACRIMSGIAILQDMSGTRRDTLIDGLRFTTGQAAEDGATRVRIKADLHHLPPLQLPDLAPDIVDACLDLSAKLSMPSTDNDARHEARVFADWLSDMLATAPSSNMAKLADSIAAMAQAPRPGRTFLDASIRAQLHEGFHALGAIGVRADETLHDDANGHAHDGAGRLAWLRQEATAIWLEMLAACDTGQDEYATHARAWCTAVLDVTWPVGVDTPARDVRLLKALLAQAASLLHAVTDEAAPPAMPSLGAIGYFLMHGAGALRTAPDRPLFFLEDGVLP
jgi:hypothetical protein